MKSKTFTPFVVFCIIFLSACSIISGEIINEEFTDNRNDWGIEINSQWTVDIQNGELQIAVHSPYYAAWTSPSSEDLESVHLETTVRDESIDSKSLFGFVCNLQKFTDEFYYIAISPDGYYAFIKTSIFGDDIFLKDGHSDFISESGSELRLGADCAPGLLALYINDQFIDSVSDTEYPYTSGQIGLFASSNEVPSGVNVYFNNFIVTRLDN